MQELKLLTNAWLGDEETVFALPDGWDATVYEAKGAPAIDVDAIRKAVLHPLGCRRLSETAAGKRSAVIVVDDLTRPTPAAEVIPFVLAELRTAGVPDDGIRFVIGVGTHRTVTPDEAAKKVGADVAMRYPVICHEAFSGTLTGLGNLDDGTPLYVNEHVARADVRVLISTVMPHSGAGFGGGAKLVLPGVAGYATVHYNHRLLPKRTRGLLQHATPGDLRDGAIAAARRLGIDLCINVVTDTQRRIVGVFSGDIEQAHDAACHFAAGVCQTPIARSDASSADVLIINAYPQDNDTQCFYKSLWPRDLFPNAYHVVIDPCTDRVWYHGLTLGMDYARFLRIEAQRSPTPPQPRPAIMRHGQMITWSEGYPPHEYYKRYPTDVLYASWDELVSDLERVCPHARVAVIPCAPLQLANLY
jgi:nickel-dependent lactate racemase